uniref:Cytochrome c oxidase subunit 2 n=1 Tax=Clathrina clathrus TaxID=1031547 RepID=L0HQQ8_CLACL|nr:cytochrome c oxidase subunit 2 [Clathrina clathrus]AGB07382.1 cytochrome c oxidase subunit 2 [Clathrina clathrus]
MHPGGSFGESLLTFHDTTLAVLNVLFTIIAFISAYRLYSIKSVNLNFIHLALLEKIYTIVPVVILAILGFPSINMIYYLEESYLSSLTVKVTGNQYYYQYGYSFRLNYPIDSYMVPLEDLGRGDTYLEEVTEILAVPIGVYVRFLVTSNDVIHSYSLPALALKIDAVPGRINSVTTLFNRAGFYYGQCSELCGANHAFMPIVVATLPLEFFSEQS